MCSRSLLHYDSLLRIRWCSTRLITNVIFLQRWKLKHPSLRFSRIFPAASISYLKETNTAICWLQLQLIKNCTSGSTELLCGSNMYRKPTGYRVLKRYRCTSFSLGLPIVYKKLRKYEFYTTYSLTKDILAGKWKETMH